MVRDGSRILVISQWLEYHNNVHSIALHSTVVDRHGTLRFDGQLKTASVMFRSSDSTGDSLQGDLG